MQTLPNGFDIPLPFFHTSFHIYFYGILIMAGVVAAAFLGQAEAKRRGMNPDFIWDALFWVVLAGIVGARLWHIFTPPPSMVEQGITTKWYLTHPLDMINIRNGGLGIPGAIIGGALALVGLLPEQENLIPDLGGYGHPGCGAGPGDWSLGEFLQPGTVWATDQPALEDIH